VNVEYNYKLDQLFKDFLRQDKKRKLLDVFIHLKSAWF